MSSAGHPIQNPRVVHRIYIPSSTTLSSFSPQLVVVVRLELVPRFRVSPTASQSRNRARFSHFSCAMPTADHRLGQPPRSLVAATQRARGWPGGKIWVGPRRLASAVLCFRRPVRSTVLSWRQLAGAAAPDCTMSCNCFGL